MTPDRFHRIDELLAEALELDEAARVRHLDAACAGDPTLRLEVETLLGHTKATENFLERPPIDAVMATLTKADRAETTPHPAIDNGRFVPGDIVAGRYRIASLLGRGGMGEVYRADDLKLGQPVALKFLAESLSTSGAALARFHREVSLARQVSHRHVCRVHDIGEHDGLHFLSMEYVRGEELSSLLKRIGRLPLDKAVETARQLCAGLSAIHAAGVLHRDLKPANVMIDAHGDVRITDFGIAGVAEGVSGREAMIGTPAYMSPEQLEGRELTTRSDLYSLGLVLYELFTGKRPFASTALADVIRERLGDTMPTHPTDWIADLDPVVERAILRCLEKDPARRPASALQVSAALPGGDPLAAALAAGETPSPQMVAAAAGEGSLRPRSAMLLLAAIFSGFAITALWSRQTSLHHFVPLEHSSEVLRARALEIAREGGYTATPADRIGAFRLDSSGPAPSVHYWYRQSLLPLQPFEPSGVDDQDPPSRIAGMVTMQLDTTGRLMRFEAVPPQEERAAANAQPFDWSRFFARAGLPMASFRSTSSKWTPPQASDARAAWSGINMRVEAASYRGAPVYFAVIQPWQKPEREPATLAGTPGDPFWIVLLVFYFGAMALAVLLSWRNLRLGRGDRRGAARLMLFGFVIRTLFWVVSAHHLPTQFETVSFVEGLQSAIYWAVLLGLLYLAIEPFVRRRWPESLISWSRLLTGRFRDPLVGSHVLIGGALGIGAVLCQQLFSVVPPLLGMRTPPPLVNSPLLYSFGLEGARGFLPLLFNQISGSLLFSMILTALVLFFAMFTKRNAFAIAATWLVLYLALNIRYAGGTAVGYLLGVLLPTLMLLAFVRHGLLALVSMIFFVHLSAFYPVKPDLSAWYAGTFVIELMLLSAMALYSCRVALAGQKVWTAGFLDP
jgi:serine/threonine-protein kinase